MSTQKILPVAYHQQDTDYYCGAACVQMILSTFNLGLIDQNVLYNENHLHSVRDGNYWYTGPDGLEWTMRYRDPGNHGFTLSALDHEAAISRMIALTIETQGVPSIAMVYTWQHWIVVHGYTASAPANAAGGFTIQSFDVSNPWPPVPSVLYPRQYQPPPPPHVVNDDCGSSEVHGMATQNISYPEWQNTYMLAIPSGHWVGKFIALTGPPPTRPSPPKGLRARKPPPGTVRHLLKPAEAIKHALEGLKEYGLTKRRSYAIVLEQTRPGEPLLVQRLDRLDSFYYIVPLRDKSGEVGMVIAIDADTGEYLESAVRSRATGGIFSLVSREEARARVIGRAIELPDKQGRLLVRDEAAQLYSHLVWKPCRESLSAFWVFHMFTVGGQRIYVRGDGSVFTELRVDGRGL